MPKNGKQNQPKPQSVKVTERVVLQNMREPPPTARQHELNKQRVARQRFRANAAGNAQNVAQSAAPVAYGAVVRTSRPRIKAIKNGWNVGHSEFAFTFVATANWCNAFAPIDTPTPSRVNPGNMLLFPWLCKFASRAEMYRFRYLKVRLVTKVPTNTGGNLYTAFDLDSTDTAPTNPVQIMNYEGAASGPVWSNDVSVTLDVEDAKVGTPTRYVSLAFGTGGDTTTSQFNRLNDIAQFFLFAGGLGDGDGAGMALCDVYVDYDVDLLVAQIPSNIVSTFYTNLTTNISSGDWAGPAPFGSSVTGIVGSIPFGFGTAAGQTGSQLSLPALGNWILRLSWTGGVIDTAAFAGVTVASVLDISGGIVNIGYGEFGFGTDPSTFLTRLTFAIGITVVDAANTIAMTNFNGAGLFSTAPIHFKMSIIERGSFLF